MNFAQKGDRELVMTREFAVPRDLVDRAMGGKLLLPMSVLYESAEALAAVRKSGREQGVAVSYERLEALLGDVAA